MSYKNREEIIKSKHINSPTVDTVNSRGKSLNTVNSRTVREEIEALLKEKEITPEGVAKMLSEFLDDEKSLSYYLILAKEHSQGSLLEAAYITKETYQRGSIRTTRPIYFQAILRRWGLQTKFKKE